MDLVPETPYNRKTVETGIHNLEVSGVQTSEPGTVVAGDTPAGTAFYDAVTDTIYLGPKVMGQREQERCIFYEHEQIHAEQFKILMGEPHFSAEDIEEVNQEAITHGLDIGEQFVEEILFDGRIWSKNAPIVFGLATGDEEIIGAVEDAYYGMLEISEPEVNGGIGTVNKPYRGDEKWLFEELSDIEAAIQPFMSDIARETDDEIFYRWKEYENRELPDHIMEGAAQFWQLFRLAPEEMVENLEFERIQLELENIDEGYSENPLYDQGEEVRAKTEEYIYQFQNMLDEMSPYDAAAEVVNQSYDELIEAA